MTSQGFSFPPPPPPPPPQQHPPSFQTPASPYGQSGYGARGGRGSGGQHRGRGRGYGGRGGRGGHFGAPNPGHTAPYHANPPAAVNQSYAQVNYGAYPAPHYPTAASSASPSPYNASRPTSYQPSHGQPGFAPGQPYAQSPAPHLPSYPPQPSYDTSYNASTKLPQSTSYPPPTPAGFPSSIPPPPPPPHTSTSAPHAPPAVMGPPMRWGFDDRRPTRYYPEGTRSFKPNPSYGLRPLNTSNPYPGPTPAADKFTRNGNKRPYSSAFGKPQATAPQTLAPPPVPSFGNPLPAKPPPAVDPTRKPKKKKRKHNQLGLTPKTDEHESSEEEDDVDEEAKLGQGKVSGPLQFTYKGRTSTLQTPEEIAAWIEERKKRYPTQARIEEKKKAMEEAKKARDEALKEKEKQKEEARRQQKEARAQKERDKLERKEQREQSTDPIDAALKAKLKAEKLRRKLIKEEKRVARAEADAERARLRAEALQKAAKIGHAGPDTQQETAQDPPATTTTNPLVEEEKSVQALEDEGEAPNGIPSTVEPAATGETSQMGPDGHISASSEESDTSDWTSSSGSDLSSSESEDSDDDSAPEEVSSRREGPERVAPPPREAKKKKLCRHFARNGRCSRGDKCRFLHEKPDKRTGDKRGKEKPRRKGLLQALLARQREDEDRRVMQAIMLLGERGMLDEPAAEGPKPTPDSIPDGEKADDAVGGAVSGSAPAPETVGGEASV